MVPGSAGRPDRAAPSETAILFRPGRGTDGDQPPNNWRSVFGGPSWTRVTESDGSPGEWYYHLFAPEQPDLNWRNPDVLPEFSDVLAFWLARGVDGFRIDVSDAPMKDPGFPDTADEQPLIPKDEASGVHDIYRAFRRVFDSFDGDRMAVVETGCTRRHRRAVPASRRDESGVQLLLHPQPAGTPTRLRDAITSALAANDAGRRPHHLGHRQPRHATLREPLRHLAASGGRIRPCT